MNLLATLNIVAACFSLILAGLVLRLRPRAALNRWVALWCFVYCLYAFGQSFVMSASDPAVFWVAYRLSRFPLEALLPLSLILQVVFAGLRGWAAWAAVGPVMALVLVEWIRLAFGEVIVSGFRPGPWGNLAVLNHDFWSVYHTRIVPAYSCAIELIVLAWAWIRHSSRLYRAFLWKYLALNVVAMGCGLFGLVAWLVWGPPDFSFVFGLIFSVGMFGLISWYPFLSKSTPSMDAARWSNLRSPVLALDPDGKVLHASGEAIRLFGMPEKDLVGRSLPELLGGSGPRLDTAADQAWQASVGSNRFDLKATPSLDRFGQIQAWYIGFAPSSGYQGQGFGLSAREWEVARLVIDGLPSKDIGERLFISPVTIPVVLTVATKTAELDHVTFLSGALPGATTAFKASEPPTNTVAAGGSMLTPVTDKSAGGVGLLHPTTINRRHVVNAVHSLMKTPCARAAWSDYDR